LLLPADRRRKPKEGRVPMVGVMQKPERNIRSALVIELKLTAKSKRVVPIGALTTKDHFTRLTRIIRPSLASTLLLQRLRTSRQMLGSGLRYKVK